MTASLTSAPVHPQLAQFLESYVRVYGHEPSSDEIIEFETRNFRQQPLSGEGVAHAPGATPVIRAEP